MPSSNSEFVNDAESVREGLRRCAQLEDPREVAACVVEVVSLDFIFIFNITLFILI